MWDKLSRSILTSVRLRLEFRFFFSPFPTFFRLFCIMKCMHDTRMAVDVIFHYMHICRSHDMSSFSHIPKRISRQVLCRRWTDNHVFNVMTTASATPDFPRCCGTTCARIAMQWYVRLAVWMIILHSVIGLTMWSVSCCRPAVLRTAGSDYIALQ